MRRAGVRAGGSATATGGDVRGERGNGGESVPASAEGTYVPLVWPPCNPLYVRGERGDGGEGASASA
eukprot:1304646-Pyramimonas_sp.AAC.1